MESNDLKSPLPPDDAPLETWLRANASLPPLPDAGFSHRVLAALPPPVRRSRPATRLAVIFLGAAAGVGLLAFQFFPGAPAEFRLSPLGFETADLLGQLSDPKLPVALGITVVSLAFVFWRDLRRRVGL